MTFSDSRIEAIEELRGLIEFCKKNGQFEVAAEISALVFDLENHMERHTDELQKLVAEIENQIAS